MRWMIIVVTMLFSLNIFAEIRHEGDSVLLSHSEEKNVSLPDNLKNMQSTSQEHVDVPEDIIQTK